MFLWVAKNNGNKASNICLFTCLNFFFEAGSHFVTQASLELITLLPQPLQAMIIGITTLTWDCDFSSEEYDLSPDLEKITEIL